MAHWTSGLKPEDRPWYLTSPSKLFWRSRAYRAVHQVHVQEIAERISEEGDKLLLRILDAGVAPIPAGSILR